MTQKLSLFPEEFVQSRFMFSCANLFKKAEKENKLDDAHLSSQREALASFDLEIGVTAQPVAGPSNSVPTGGLSTPPRRITTTAGKKSGYVVPNWILNARKAQDTKEAARAGGLSTGTGPFSRAGPSSRTEATGAGPFRAGPSGGTGASTGAEPDGPVAGPSRAGPSGQGRAAVQERRTADPPAPTTTRRQHGPPTEAMSRLSVDVERPVRLAALEEEEEGPMDVDGDEGSRGSKRKRDDEEDEYDDGEDELEDEEDWQKPTSATLRGRRKVAEARNGESQFKQMNCTCALATDVTGLERSVPSNGMEAPVSPVRRGSPSVGGIRRHR